MCDEWMRRLGAQDDIKEEVLTPKPYVWNVCPECGAENPGAIYSDFTDGFICSCRYCGHHWRTRDLQEGRHLHKERVKPKP